MLRVQNNTGNDLTDRYNGTDYTFPAGASVALDENAAQHIFGFGDADKVPYLVRQGWMRTTGEYESAMRILSGFAFSAYEIPIPGEIVQKPIPQQIAEAEEEEDSTPKEASPPKASRGSILDKLASNAV
jgi:hypothetical protein